MDERRADSGVSVGSTCRNRSSVPPVSTTETDRSVSTGSANNSGWRRPLLSTRSTNCGSVRSSRPRPTATLGHTGTPTHAITIAEACPPRTHIAGSLSHRRCGRRRTQRERRNTGLDSDGPLNFGPTAVLDICGAPTVLARSYPALRAKRPTRDHASGISHPVDARYRAPERAPTCRYRVGRSDLRRRCSERPDVP